KQAENNVESVKEERRHEQQDWRTFIRGLAHQTLANLGVDDEIDKAIQLFEGLTTKGERETELDTDLTYGGLADALLKKGETDRAADIIEEGLKLTPEPDNLLRQKSQLLALRGQFDEALKLFTDKDERFLFEQSLSRMLGRGPIDAEALKKDMNAF